MRISSTVSPLIVALAGAAVGQQTWPSSVDELEDVMFLNTGYKSRGFSSHITPCSYSEFGAGRQTAAEWLRMGFHDMATTNVYFAPHGGIDASMIYEFQDGENVGAGFNTTLYTYGGLYNSRLSMADLIALGVYASVRGCGGPVVPMRGGRIDATAAGPVGVPQPQNSRGTFQNQFLRMGFNNTDMIQMTACGHTLGGVHAEDFPTIVAPGTAPNDFQLFTDTGAFDNHIATRYVNGPDTDPLAVGISVASTRNSDLTVFAADGNVTLKAMTDATTFNNMCSSILQRMIETVDPSIVTLSAVIQPYEVKPSGLQLTLLAGGTEITFSGDIRVRTTVRSASQISSVQILYNTRTGESGGTISSTISGVANGFDDTFTFYGFSASIPAASSISSFTVLITPTTGSAQTYDNNGSGFPIQDSVIVQTSQSCVSNGNLSVVAAVRSTVTSPVVLGVTVKVPRGSGIPVPSLSDSTVGMTAGSTLGPYTLYSGSFAISQITGAKYSVSSGSLADAFKDASGLGSACAATPPSASTSTSSTTSSTIPTASPTLTHKEVVGSYIFQGCYTEGDGVRALSDKVFYNTTAMTIELCASDCAGYTYFGVEYHEECYCGNTLASSSVLTTLSDCYHVCPGDSYEYCGAGNRLELYKLSGSSTAVQTTSTSSTASASPTLQIVPSAGSYTYAGCYTEGSSSRALGSTSSASDTMTIESCVASCDGYAYAGTEYGRECYCGDSFSTGSVLTSDSDCYFTCSGSDFEYCGAGNRLSVYARSGAGSSGGSNSSSSNVNTLVTSTQTSTTSATATQTTLGIKPTIGAYSYLGCQTEGSSGRALTGSSTWNYTTMTLEICASICSSPVEYTYFGVEYGGECYCGNDFSVGSVSAPDTDCYFVCPGDNFEYCGAGNRLSAYVLT